MSGDSVSTLIEEAEYKEELTSNHETDCHTALTRGLKEFLLSIPASVLIKTPNKSQKLMFQSVEEDWVEPSNESAKFPMAGVYTVEPGIYDATDFTSKVIELDDGELLKVSAELLQLIVVDVWAGNRPQRQELCKILEDYFSPVDWMDGFRLRLPHYFGATAEFALVSIDYVDSEENSAKRWRMAQFQIEASVQKISLLGKRPKLQPKLQLTVRDDR